ncbi:hypothetical protein VTO73DRAFT_6510 [Trametes versicolor]
MLWRGKSRANSHIVNNPKQHWQSTTAIDTCPNDAPLARCHIPPTRRQLFRYPPPSRRDASRHPHARH